MLFSSRVRDLPLLSPGHPWTPICISLVSPAPATCCCFTMLLHVVKRSVLLLSSSLVEVNQASI